MNKIKIIGIPIKIPYMIKIRRADKVLQGGEICYEVFTTNFGEPKLIRASEIIRGESEPATQPAAGRYIQTCDCTDRDDKICRRKSTENKIIMCMQQFYFIGKIK